jgi:hypothetical protein
MILKQLIFIYSYLHTICEIEPKSRKIEIEKLLDFKASTRFLQWAICGDLLFARKWPPGFCVRNLKANREWLFDAIEFGDLLSYVSLRLVFSNFLSV